MTASVSRREPSASVGVPWPELPQWFMLRLARTPNWLATGRVNSIHLAGTPRNPLRAALFLQSIGLKMSLRWTVVSLLVFMCAPALAKTDYYGREIGPGVHLQPISPVAGDAGRVAATSGFQLLGYQAHATSSWPDSVAVGDVSGDGLADVVLTTTFYFDEVNDYHVFLFKQATNGTLLAPTTFPYGQTPSYGALALADLDGQNGLDVVVGGDLGITPFLATPAGGLAARPLVTTEAVNVLLPMTLNSLGRVDLLGGNYSTTAYLYLNNGAGTLTPTPLAVPYEGAHGFAKGDLDGDGHEDVIYSTRANYPAPATIHIYRNNLDGSFQPLPALTDACPNNFGITDMAIGDVNGDGLADIVTSGGGNLPQTCIQIFPGIATGGFGPARFLASYQIPEAIVVTDIDNDGRDDIIVLHGGWLRIGVYLQQTDGNLAPESLYEIPYATSYETNTLAVGDFTGDGCPDVAIADYNHGLVTLQGSGCVDRIFDDGFD